MNKDVKKLSPALILLLLLTSFAAAHQAQAPTNTLEPGKSIEQTIAGGETQSLTVSLPAGAYALLDVLQKGVNLTVTVFNGSQQLRKADLNSVGFSEQISLVGQAATVYRIEVNPTDKHGRRGAYVIKLSETRRPTEQDVARVEGEKLMEVGMQFLVNSEVNQKPQAIESFQKSVSFWKTAKDPEQEANAFYFIAYTMNLEGDYQKANEAADQGLLIARAAGLKQMEAYLLEELGTSLSNRGERKKALDIYQQALALRSKDDPMGLATTLGNIGTTYAYIGESAKALGYMEQVVKIMHDMGERQKESTTQSNMCVVYKDLGQFKKGLEVCNEALNTKRDLGDLSGEATVLSNMGGNYAGLGAFQQALDVFQQSRAIHKRLNEREGEAITTNNIGWTYGQLGEPEKAIECYMQVLQYFRDAHNKYGVATLLSNIGVSYANLQDFRKALEFHLESLPLRLEKDDRSGRAITLNNIANCYAKLGEPEKALEYYTEGIRLLRAMATQRQLALSLKNVGSLYRDQGKIDKALEFLNEARTISTTIGDPSTHAAVLSELARLELDRGNAIAARKLIEDAIASIESVRTNLKSQQLRASFLASVRKYYEIDIEALMRMHQQQPNEGYAAAALQVSEKSRARSLLEMLREARAEIQQGIDPALIERESTLRRTIGDKADQQTRLLSGKHTEEQALASAKEMNALTSEYDGVQAQIRQASPRYAALVEPSPIGVEAIQKQVLDQNTLLLEYALGEQKSFVWAMTPDSIKVFELPGRATIELEAKRFYQLLTQRDVTLPNETVASKQQRLSHADSEYPAAAANMSRMLLAPVAAELKQKRIVVVAEGVLQYVPFSALPSPGAGGSRPLIVEHEIVTAPSASVLALLREEFANRKPATKAVAVLADPVFSANDGRLNRNTSLAADSSVPGDAQRSAAESGLGDLVRLRFSRVEADEIARLAADKRNLKALDFSANRAVATDAKLGDYRIVHFATHSLINNQHPDLSGIVLSLVNEQGKPQNGFLRLYDIYNLKLNADLVVLSSCQTALGKEIKGEGLVGLTRGFMYAGAPRVVASFWRIDDRATAEMMRRFYESMLKDGLTPAAALRTAQVSMLSEKRWQSPHFWAAFTIQGEWR